MDPDQARRIRALIDCLELCHHRAERRVDLIVEAIGRGHTAKGYQAREPESTHPATQAWQNAVAILGAWLDGNAAKVEEMDVVGHNGKELAAALGEPTELKRWQVGRVIAKLKNASRMYPGSKYDEIVEHPEKYADSHEFRDMTAQVEIHDTRNGERAEISLAAAVDHLQPCNWNFADNLLIVLCAINGQLEPLRPFAAHGRNAGLNPIRGRMLAISNALAVFCGRAGKGDPDGAVLSILGERSADKEVLATALQEKIESVFL